MGNNNLWYVTTAMRHGRVFYWYRILIWSPDGLNFIGGNETWRYDSTPPFCPRECLVSFLVSCPWWDAYDFISEDDVDLQTKIMNCNVWWFIAAACLLVGVVGLVVINILHHKDREPDYSVSLYSIYTYTLEIRILFLKNQTVLNKQAYFNHNKYAGAKLCIYYWRQVKYYDITVKIIMFTNEKINHCLICSV